MEMTSSTDVSPTTTPCGTPLSGAPKYGTVIPNRIFVGGIAANTTEQELKQFFSAYGAVKDSKIIADRAGVSKGYGFITFENQEDADRIIKKEVSVESDNLVFRDRKLNIGPAIRKQQVLPRAFESPVSPGAVMFSNGVPYTYQNGMAVFASPETGYAVPQAQPQTALMVPQTPPLYLQQPYTYQMPMSYANIQTSPQWAATAAAAAASQWRYMTQSPTTALTATANPYMIAMQPDFMYAQIPQYQTADMGDTTTMFDGTAGVEGSILPVEESLQAANKSTVYVTEGLTSPVHGANLAAATLGCYGSLPLPVVSGYEPGLAPNEHNKHFQSETGCHSAYRDLLSWTWLYSRPIAQDKHENSMQRSDESCFPKKYLMCYYVVQGKKTRDEGNTNIFKFEEKGVIEVTIVFF
ncbi:hypothetical protein DPMN_059066 [Dreissena polymorpha]|uniref:RRM domain-containing protein n=1 Tax=Dreissena polymorpha TaxID=45954 RepID=A0A9D4HEI4_DREPO|nr:hypothetical protein DPMN_059066 [Dreissena polymorpha]